MHNHHLGRTTGPRRVKGTKLGRKGPTFNAPPEVINKTLTPEEREHYILEAREQGITLERIAEMLNVSTTTINSVIKRARRQKQFEKLNAFAPQILCYKHLVAGCPQCP